MTQDFAKIRPEPILERKPVEAPPAWSLMLTGVVVGITIGVFGSFLFYLSGNVPPLVTMQPAAAAVAQQDNSQVEDGEDAEAGPGQLNFEFYTALPNYEVKVDATPVTVRNPTASNEPNTNPETPLATSFILQTGAFQQQELANLEMQRQQNLGLDVRVKQETSMPGRTLFLVQSGPYTTQSQLAGAERILRDHNIQFLKTTPR